MTDPGIPEADAPSPGAGDDPEAASRMASLRAQQARVLAQLERMRASLEQRRPRSQMIDSAFRAFEHDVAAGGGVLAGAVAFRVFLFLVPYSFVFVVGLGIGANAKHHDAGDLARAAGIGGLAAKAMASVGDLSTSQRVISLAVALFALLLATRALLKVLRIVHALIWHTQAGKLPKTNRAVVVVVLLVSLAFALALLVGRLRDQSLLLGIIGTALFILVPIVLWTFASAFLPHRADVPWTALIPGGVVFGVGAELLHVVTIYWISHEVDSKTATYGAIGFALALLFWAYLLGRLVTTAAIVNETLWTRYQERLAAHRVHDGDSAVRGDE